MRRCRCFWHIAAFIAVFAGAIAVVMLLWNAIIPDVIGWSAISYCQAAGLIVLCKLLFGGLGRHMGRLHRRGHEHAHLHEKLKGMSRDERRSYIRQRMLGFGHCCGNKQSAQNASEE